MAIDKLINSTQGDSIIAALNAISSKVGSPYNLENKLNPAYINYDSTHAATPETVANSGITSTDVAQIEMNKNNISWLVDTGVKNLLDYGKIKTFNPLFTWSGNTGTYNGVTIKIESNAVKISASNASSTVHIYVSSETDTWKNGNTYRLMGVQQASAENVNLNIQSGSPDYYTYYTKISNQEVTFPNVDTRIRFSIASGATFSEVTIPLMMCSVTAYSASPAYQPYAMSNAELTEQIQSGIGVPTITSSTTLADYANALSSGYHIGFFTSTSKPSDSPVSDNCFCDFFVYSAYTAIMKVYPSGTAYHDAIYYRTKVSGTWRSWFKFQGTAVT